MEAHPQPELDFARGAVIAVMTCPDYPVPVTKLDVPDAHHFNAACGWLELGNRAEARVELELVSPENQNHPAVLELRWSLCLSEKKWDEAFRWAQKLMVVQPDEPAGWLHCAYALRRMKGGGVDQAWAFLRPVAEKFPDEPVIAFNLACYACQLNQLDDARLWLKRAGAIGGVKEILAMALADADLKLLWPEIKAQIN